MEGLMPYKNIWRIEFHKLCSSDGRKYGLMIASIVFMAFPWLTLVRFEERFEFFKWHYLDESYLNFVIYKSGNIFLWIMIVIIPWLYHLLFGEGGRQFLRKSNKLFARLIYNKVWMYVAIGLIFIAIYWASTLVLYWYWCISNEVSMETNTWSRMWPPAGQLYLRYLAVLPLILVLFLAFGKKASYTILVLILLFSVFLIFRIPFHFHYNVHQPAFNWQTTYHALISGLILAVGLFVYYRFISTKLYVFP